MPQIDSAQTECSHKGPDFLNTAGGGQGNAGRILVPTSRSGAKILQPWTTRSARVVTIKIRSSTQVSGLDTDKIWRRGSPTNARSFSFATIRNRFHYPQ